MASQDAIQDRNRFPGLIAHSGTSGTAELRKVVATSGGAITAGITDGTNDLYIWGSGAISVAKAVHWRVKESKEFMASYEWDDLANGGTAYFHIKTGSAKTAHGNIIVYSDNRSRINLYEDSSLSSDGTAVTAYCMNRETDGTPVTSIYHTASVGTIGTKLECGILGAAGKFSTAGGETTGAYWLLKPSEDYIVEIVNTSGTIIDVCVGYQWHEHTAA